MKHPLRIVLLALSVAILLRPGNSCGPFFDEDVFFQQNDPDPPYAQFVAGRLGLVQGQYRIRHLVVAYNMLSGRGLSPAEKKAAADADAFFNSPDEQATAYVSSCNSPGQKTVAGQPEWSSVCAQHKVPGQDYEYFSNCLDDAFSTARETLQDRRAHFGRPNQPDSPEIADWIAGQQAVFSNCAAPGQMPAPAPANAPLWLRQDRAMQVDRARLGKACCTPAKFVTLQSAPAPTTIARTRKAQ